MTPEEIRIKAIELALEHAANPEQHIQVARQFEAYIVGTDAVAPIVLGISADPEPQYIGHTEPDVWGAPCTGCRHSSALHLHDGCTYPECGCTRNEQAALSGYGS